MQVRNGAGRRSRLAAASGPAEEGAAAEPQPRRERKGAVKDSAPRVVAAAAGEPQPAPARKGRKRAVAAAEEDAPSAAAQDDAAAPKRAASGRGTKRGTAQDVAEPEEQAAPAAGHVRRGRKRAAAEQDAPHASAEPQEEAAAGSQDVRPAKRGRRGAVAPAAREPVSPELPIRKKTSAASQEPSGEGGTSAMLAESICLSPVWPAIKGRICTTWRVHAPSRGCVMPI